MNEIILAVLAIGLLILPKLLLSRLKQPRATYIKFTCAIVLLVFAWVANADSNLATKVLLTIVVIFSAYKNYIELRKFGLESNK